MKGEYYEQFGTFLCDCKQRAGRQTGGMAWNAGYFAQPALFKHYGVKNFHELKLAVGDDFYAVEVPYESPNASAIYAAFDWYMDGNVDAEERTLTTPGCFADAEELEDLEFSSGLTLQNILMWKSVREEWRLRLMIKYALV